jgi:hypothetical protein
MRKPARPRTDPDASLEIPHGFLDAWQQLIGPAGVPALPRRRGRKPRVPLAEVLPTLVFHVLNGPGTLAEHGVHLFGTSLADSSWSDRRARLPWTVFADLMRRALRPRATRRQRDAFWRGWRLVAIDATQFSLTNTPQILATLPKARARRGPAAFAKMTTNVLLELGALNPVAAAIGHRGESEWALAPQLLAQLPQRALLLADRLYGCGAFAWHAAAACTRVGSHFLLRARHDVKPRVLRRLSDGSRVIRVRVRDTERPAHIREWLEMREIRVRVGRRGHRAHELRLWTSLLAPATAPALELAQLYARRWEHELYFRYLKRTVRTRGVLQSHTVDTAAQEIAALLLVSALLATERARIAGGPRPVPRVSFVKVVELVRPLWLMLSVFDDLVTDRQKTQVVQRVYARMRRYVMPTHRPRSCLRAVRQPMKWPRLLQPQSVEGPLHFTLL